LQAERDGEKAKVESGAAALLAEREARVQTKVDAQRTHEQLRVQERIAKLADTRAAQAEEAAKEEEAARNVLQEELTRSQAALEAETDASAALAMRHRV
jgi:hypothetical protein